MHQLTKHIVLLRMLLIHLKFKALHEMMIFVARVCGIVLFFKIDEIVKLPKSVLSIDL